jgi:hypothetical protein
MTFTMSAIAWFKPMPVSALDGLRIAAVPKKQFFGPPKNRYGEYLRKFGKEIVEYRLSGYGSRRC